jgi:hypothetical protein
MVTSNVVSGAAVVNSRKRLFGRAGVFPLALDMNLSSHFTAAFPSEARPTSRLLFAHGVFVTGLIAAAVWMPVPLYLFSLALFGLPHIIWELAFLRSRYGARWTARWWGLLWFALLLQAAVRTAVWSKAYPAELAAIADVLTLLIVALIVTLAPRGTPWRTRLAGAILAGATWYLLEQGEVISVLLILALLHNFTPLALAWDLARDHPPARPLAWGITMLFAIPLLLPVAGLMTDWPLHAVAFLSEQSEVLDRQLPASWSTGLRPALLSSMVLAQCLHYYCVIVLLPQAEHRRTQRQPLGSWPRYLAWGAALLLTFYFAIDYSSARGLYAVAAGAHAWLEWPVLIMALTAMRTCSGHARWQG